jgi:hypothetical protein
VTIVVVVYVSCVRQAKSQFYIVWSSCACVRLMSCSTLSQPEASMGCHRGSGAFRTWTRTRIRFGLSAFSNQVMATMNLLAIFLLRSGAAVFFKKIWQKMVRPNTCFLRTQYRSQLLEIPSRRRITIESILNFNCVEQIEC